MALEPPGFQNLPFCVGFFRVVGVYLLCVFVRVFSPWNNKQTVPFTLEKSLRAPMCPKVKLPKSIPLEAIIIVLTCLPVNKSSTQVS